MKQHISVIEFVLCIRNSDCEDLETRKIYQVIADSHADEEGLIRVIDDSGEDYLYPADFFVPIEVPAEAKRVPVLAV
jgi:hypothetical protein